MTCTTARERLLTADPADLRGLTESDVSRHVGTCHHCRAIAEALLAAQQALEGELHAVPPRDAIGAARRAVLVAARRRARARVVRWAVPVAAAAGLVALLLPRQATMRVDVTAPTAIPPTPRPAAIIGPAGRNVVVLHTDNPDVLVVWFY